CRFMVEWGQPCAALPLDEDEVDRRMASDHRLERIRVRRAGVDPWLPLGEQERVRAARIGFHRPPSFLLYPFLAFMRWMGEPWVPPAPVTRARVTWAQARATPLP